MRRRRFTLAACLALLLLPLFSPGVSLAANGPGGPRPVATALPTPSSAPDLAAMALTPDDLSAAGYGLLSSYRWSAGDLAIWDAADASEAAREKLQLATYGFAAAWYGALGLPSIPSDPGSSPAKEVDDLLVAFDSADHAHEAYILLVQGVLDSGWRPENVLPNVGDDARSLTYVDSVGDHIRDLIVRTGAVVFDARLLYAEQVPAPTLAETQALAKTLIARIGDAVKSDGPGLSQRALRLDLSLSGVGFGAGGISSYERLNGKDLAYYGLTADQLKSRYARYAAAVNTYHELQYPAYSQTEPDYSGRLYQFTSAAEATDWIAKQTYLTGVTMDHLVTRTNPPAVGDQSAEYLFDERDGNGGVIYTVAVVFRVGDVAVSIAVDQANTHPSIASVEQLAKLQAACLASKAPCPPAPAKLATATQSS